MKKQPKRGKQPYQYQPKMTGKIIKPWSPVLLVIIIILGCLFWLMTWGSMLVDIFAMEGTPVVGHYAEYEENGTDNDIIDIDDDKCVKLNV